LQLRMKLGGAYNTAGPYSYRSSRLPSNTATYSASSTESATSILVGNATSFGTGSANSLDFVLYTFNPASTAFNKHVIWQGICQEGVNMTSFSGAGNCSAAVTALTGLRFFASSGNLVAGSFRLYGIANS